MKQYSFLRESRRLPGPSFRMRAFRSISAVFGQQPDDRCLVAEADNRVVGAIWSRIMNDYGHIADGYKSVSQSVQKANYAMKMYQKAGFKVISDDAKEAIMKCSLI